MSNLANKLLAVTKNLPAFYGNGTLTATLSADWRNIEYFPAAGLFVAVNSYNYNNTTFSNLAAWSSDGITWTASTLPASDFWGNSNHGLCNAFGYLVAVGWSSRSLAYSTNGKTWAAGTSTPSLYANGIAYSSTAGAMIVVYTDLNGNPGSKTIHRITSVTGAWTPVTLAYFPLNVIVANNKFFIYGFTNVTDANPSALLTSTDGITWTTQSMPPALAGTTAINYRRIAYGNGRYVTIGSIQAANVPTPVAYSTDGVTWTPSTFGLPYAYWDEIVFTGKYFLCCNRGVGAGRVYYSYDGNFWYPIGNTGTGIGNNYLKDIAYGNGIFVACTPYYRGNTNITVVGTA